MLPSTKNFEQLPTYFEGNSRILKNSSNPDILICKLKPTVFSLQENGPVLIPGIDSIRTQLNAILCNVLHQHGIKTSTLATNGEFIFMQKLEVPPIEVVVKAAMIGSPKHIYKNINETVTRFHAKLAGKHSPYVRFDWRNPLPHEDQCMPTGLADQFIDTKQASETALKAFEVLQNHFQKFDLELLDICFFMNSAGNTICAEVSTDNSRLVYVGSDPNFKELFSSKDKSTALKRAKTILQLLEDQ
jgi:phosphoribosylaminoimidazole-succinocarboxamide synthase